MEASGGPIRPVEERGRCEAVDVLRGVAVLGILAMNIQSFSMPTIGYMNPTYFPEYDALNKAVYAVVHIIFDVKMMTIFSMLFGAGVWFYARKAEGAADVRPVRRLWFRRMGWLLAIGMVHAYLIWWGDILVTYAVCGLLGLWWLRRLRPGVQIGIGLALVLFSCLLSAANGILPTLYANIDSLDPKAAESISEAFKGQQQWVAPTPEQIAEEIAVHRGGYFTVLPQRALNSFIMQVGFIPFFMLWRGTGAMLLGLALARLGVMTGARSVRFYLIMMLACYGVGLPLVVGGVIYNFSNDFSLGTFALVGTQFNMVGSLPVALGHIALVMLLVKLDVLGLMGRALAATGRMALTNYLAQSIIATLIFYGYGLGLYGSLNRLEQQGVVVAIWAVQLVWSPLWLARYQFGPAEWFWRSLTYWRLQPLRR